MIPFKHRALCTIGRASVLSFRRASSSTLFFLVCFFAMMPARAFEPFVVSDIRVEGAQRTEAGTVFSYLPVKVGETFTEEKATQAVKSLFATGFFRDVRIDTDGTVLVVIIEERPSIAAVEFTGIKEFEADQLKRNLKDVGLAEARIFDRALLERAEQELKRQYLTRGKYATQVTTTVTPVERNRVRITFTVDEGQSTRIRRISIVGAHAFKEKELLEQLQSAKSGWFTWYTKADQYSRQKLQADLEVIRSYYLDRGYLEFNIESTQVSISPDKRDIFITISVVEGEPYTVSDVKLGGELLGLQDELQALLKVKPNERFSNQQVTDTNLALTNKLGSLGYAFANVTAAPDLNRENHTAAITFYLDPNRRVYVRRINILGNSRTRDEVIRREMRQFEGAWYDASKIQLSRERIDRLGYFQTVNVETPPASGTPDQVDVNVTVQERPTGSLNVGLGYSTTDKIVLSTSVFQNNLFGSGNTVGLELNTGKVNRTIALSQTNPYFTPDGISRSTQLFYRTVQPLVINVGEYTIKSFGAGMNFGVPFTETDTVYFGGAVENNTIDTSPTSPQRYIDYVNNFGRSSSALLGTIGWARDNRDNPLTPTKGRYQRFSFEATMPVGDLRYYKTGYQHQYYWPLTRSITLALNGQIDYGHGFGGKPFPLFKNVYAGGIGTVRGFDGSSLGPRDTNGDALGGASRAIGNIEVLFPFPGSQQDRSLRWFTYLDGGNVFADNSKIDLGDLRYSAGLGISWLSPIGPLKLSVGKPLNDKPTDKLQRFQFQIGTGF